MQTQLSGGKGGRGERSLGGSVYDHEKRPGPFPVYGVRDDDGSGVGSDFVFIWMEFLFKMMDFVGCELPTKGDHTRAYLGSAGPGWPTPHKRPSTTSP